MLGETHKMWLVGIHTWIVYFMENPCMLYIYIIYTWLIGETQYVTMKIEITYDLWWPMIIWLVVSVSSPKNDGVKVSWDDDIPYDSQLNENSEKPCSKPPTSYLLTIIIWKSTPTSAETNQVSMIMCSCQFSWLKSITKLIPWSPDLQNKDHWGSSSEVGLEGYTKMICLYV